MFDSKAEIGIPFHSSDGLKKVVVRFPSDAQFIQWKRGKKVVQKDLGRGSFQMDSQKPDPKDLALVMALRVDQEGGPEIDESEALYILTKLAACEASDRPEREGSGFVITLKILHKLLTKHTLRMPSVREQMDFERGRSSVIFGQYGQQRISINYQAYADLYDRLKVSVEGYAGDVPVPHKAEAINVLIQELRIAQEDGPGSDDDEESDQDPD